jgi:ComEC/Rec2-related protein
MVAAAAVVRQLLRERKWYVTPVWLQVAVMLVVTLPLGYHQTVRALSYVPAGSLAAALADAEDNAAVALRGRICSEPTPDTTGRGRCEVEVDAIRWAEGDWQSVSSGRVRLTIYEPRERYAEAAAIYGELMQPAAYGYSIEVDTRFRRSDVPRNPGAFDYAAFLRANGLDAHVFARSAYPRRPAGGVAIRERTAGNPVVELAVAAKAHFLRTYQRTMRSPGSRLAAATTLGSRSLLEGETYRGTRVPDLFRHAGVGHVLAVSGLHVSIVSLLLFGLLKLTRMPPRYFTPLIIIFLILFTLLTGARPSSVRAAIMNSGILIAFVYLHCNLRRATAVGLAASSLFILCRAPLLLFSAAFLLSFGAVLSLVLLVTPVDRALLRLRGWSLLLTLVTAAGYLLLACSHWTLFLSPWTLLSSVGVFALVICWGARLNDRWPRFWRLGLDALPETLRMFVSAQLAIQVGMMIPLSAWFFGQFPIAGVFVNLLAIPLVGVVVQLAMLTGLAAWLPLVGGGLSAALGATNTFVCLFFLYLAHLGAVVFPFPAVARPTVTWMLVYYLLLALVVIGELPALRWLQTHLYPAALRLGERRLSVVGLVAAAALALVALVNLRPPQPATVTVDICHANGVPVMAADIGGGAALLVNAGDSRTGERVLFDVLRYRGTFHVDTAVLASPSPEAGMAGVTELLARMRVRRCVVPLAPPVDTYMAALGDSYLAQQAEAGRPWAIAYPEGYAQFRSACSSHGVSVSAATAGAEQVGAVRLQLLPEQAPLPRRFVSTARTRMVRLETGDVRWLVVTDALPEAFANADAVSCDVDILVLPDIGPANRSYYEKMARAALTVATPQAVVWSVASRPYRKQPNPLPALVAALPASPILLRTDTDGAVTARTQPDGSVRLRGFISGAEAVIGGAAGP